MDRIAIIGLGLMGGSLGLALKAHGYRGGVAGYTRAPARRLLAVERGAVDEVFDDPRAAVEGADLVVYGAPILAIMELVRDTAPFLKKGAVLTDVGSTKADLAAGMARLLRRSGNVFVGSHPIAGSEQQGMESAQKDLYEGAMVVVTPGKGAPAAAVRKVRNLWRRVGAQVRVMTPGEHDAIVARTSHLPHLAATLVALTVGRDGAARVAEYCGAGFRDTSRVAEGAPEIWEDILATNRVAVVRELKALRRGSDDLSAALEKGELKVVRRILEQGRTHRQALMKKKSHVITKEGFGA